MGHLQTHRKEERKRVTYCANEINCDKANIHFQILRGSSPQNPKHIFPVIRRAFHPCRLIWCEWPRFGDNSHRDVRLLSIIMEYYKDHGGR